MNKLIIRSLITLFIFSGTTLVARGEHMQERGGGMSREHMQYHDARQRTVQHPYERGAAYGRGFEQGAANANQQQTQVIVPDQGEMIFQENQ